MTCDVSDSCTLLSTSGHSVSKRRDPQVGWLCYNDEYPKHNHEQITGTPADNWDFGHTKGVLAFDLETDTALWLLHSWPCYPPISINPVDPPSSLFGQTVLCISPKDVAMADAIARVFPHQSQPKIIDMNLPEAFDDAVILHKAEIDRIKSTLAAG